MSKGSTPKPNKKFAILVQYLPLNLISEAMSHFPERHVVKATSCEEGLEVYFDDYQHAKKYIQRRTISVKGTPYNIYALLTDLTVHGIRSYASEDTIRNIMKSYGSVFDLYQVKKKANIRGDEKVYLSDDYRINLDRPEVYASWDLSPIHLREHIGSAFEVTFYCRNCSSDGHKRSHCPLNKNSLNDMSIPQQSSKYYRRTSRETYTPGSSVKKSERNLHQIPRNLDSSTRRRSDDDTNNSSMRTNESAEKQPQNNHGIRNAYRRTSSYANTSNSLFNPSGQERSINRHLTNNHETSYETDACSIPVLLNRKIQSSYNPDMSRIPLETDGSDSLVYQNEGVQYHEIYGYEETFSRNGTSYSTRYRSDKTEHHYNHDIPNSCRRISSESYTSDLLNNQNSAGQYCDGFNINSYERMSDDSYSSYLLMDPRTGKECQTKYDNNQNTEKQFYDGYSINSYERMSENRQFSYLPMNPNTEKEYQTNYDSNQNTEEQYYTGYRIDSYGRRSEDRHFSYSPMNPNTGRECQTNHYIFNGSRRTSLENDRSNSFTNNEKLHQSNCNANGERTWELGGSNLSKEQKREDSSQINSAIFDNYSIKPLDKYASNSSVKQNTGNDHSRASHRNSPNFAGCSVKVKQEKTGYSEHIPVFQSGICRKEQSESSREDPKVAGSVHHRVKHPNKDTLSIQRGHQRRPMKKEHCATGYPKLAQEKMKSEFEDGTSAESKVVYADLHETAEKLTDINCPNSHEETRNVPPTSYSKKLRRIATKTSKAPGKKTKNQLREVLVRILPPNVDVQAIHDHLRKSVDGPADVREVATELQKIEDWFEIGVINRKLTRQENIVFRWIEKSLDKFRKMKDELNFNEQSVVESSTQREAAAEQFSSESIDKTSRRQRIRTLTPAIQEAIHRTSGVLPPEEMCNFLNQVRGRKKQMDIACVFTSDLRGLASQLTEVKKTYYVQVPKRGRQEDADISFISRLSKRLLAESNSAPEGCVEQESDCFMTQSRHDSDLLNSSSSRKGPSASNIPGDSPNIFSSVTVKEEIVDND